MACQFILADRPLLDLTAVAGHIDLPPAPSSVPTARLFARGFLADVEEDVARDCELLVSELVTNVVMHARTRIHLGLSRDDRTVLVAVQDYASHPRPREVGGADGLAESGRGLEIVARLADDFGWKRLTDGSGKLLWFTLNISERHPIVETVPRGDPLGLGGGI